ncbi:membrane protein [Jeongeupia sp. HS-3]|uniref:DMT family transporter n=1 Tax=Jeongeupia sp. HS-3 TaxID=1009682 RepID=UPI0018A5BC61|nr:DMT family transporter [Jeongeupia sp. HS-3]BCL76555.1 membrane protein [Jeongeupia sp. HS-3]
MQLMYFLLATAIGLVVPLQAAINNHLRLLIGGSTVLAALLSFGVGTIALTIAALVTGQRWAGLANLSQASAWQLGGGILGAFFVFGSTLIAPRIGVAAMISLIIAGQVCASLLFDRFGILGMPLRAIGGWRLLGALLVIVGVALVNFGDKLPRG